MAEVVKFYMQEVDKDGNLVAGTLKDLEVDFNGLKYGSCSGIESIGEVKNAYEEEYKDADGVRAYVPSVPFHSPTDVKLTIFFIGENRCATRDAFIDYISKGRHRFYDTKRKKVVVFYLKDKVEIKDSSWKGSTPYLEYEFKLRNILGKAIDI